MTTKPNILIQVDSGYQGIIVTHANSQLPKKKTKLNPLTKADKKANRKLSSQRVLNEHVISKIKRFIVNQIQNRTKGHSRNYQI